MDICDKVQQFGLQKQIPKLLSCKAEKKVIPLLPNGNHPNLIDLPFYEKQRDMKEEKLNEMLEKYDDKDEKYN